MKTLLEQKENDKLLIKVESDKGSGLVKITHAIESKRLPVASVWMSISEFKKIAKELV
jgi:hypothetical protein